MAGSGAQRWRVRLGVRHCLLLVLVAFTTTACFTMPATEGARHRRKHRERPPVTTPPPPTPTSARDPFLWPFASDSPWNMPAGSGAQFAGTSSSKHAALQAGSVYINAAQWSHPVYAAAPTDPSRLVTDPSGTSEYEIPTDATPALPTPGGDQHLHVVDPTRHWVDESWYTIPNGLDWSSGYHVRTDLRGPGVGTYATRASGASAMGGLIRTWELQQGAVRHALALAVGRDQLKVGPVWPAVTEDGNAATTYAGSLPMGTFVAIPGSVNVSGLGLSPGGLVIARALQDYGAYLSEASSHFTLYAEPSAEPLLAAARADLAAIRAQLRVVINSSPASVGGGGAPRAPLAPPLA